MDNNIANLDDPIELDQLLEKCDTLLNNSKVNESRAKFMQDDINSYEQASVLLGYFSQLKDFEYELQILSDKLIRHRTRILSSYIDILPQEYIKSLSIPSNKTKLYQKGIHKYFKVKNYIIYDYKGKLYSELSRENKNIDRIKILVATIVRLDKHYDIYEELIGNLQKNNKAFSDIMKKYMSEYIYI